MNVGDEVATIETIKVNISLTSPVRGKVVEVNAAMATALASTRAIFGLPEIKLGMVLALGGTQRLTRLIGVSAAKEMTLRGRNVTAIEAQRLGLGHRVAEHGDLMGLARSWAERDAGFSPRALALAKRLIDQSFERGADASAEAETLAQVELLHSPEFLGRIKTLKENGEI